MGENVVAAGDAGRGLRWEWSAVPLLVASGVLAILAAMERWWPVCRFGRFDDDGCIWRQDDTYDTTAYPAVTWLGQAAEDYGLWALVLGLAVVPTLRLIVGRRLPGWFIAVSVAMGASIALAGLSLTSSDRADRLLSLLSAPQGTLMAAAWLWALAWPGVLVVAVALRNAGNGAILVTVVSLVLGSPFLLWVVVGPSVMLYSSHDDTPWVDGVGGVLTIVAGTALGWLAYTQARGPTPAPTVASQVSSAR